MNFYLKITALTLLSITLGYGIGVLAGVSAQEEKVFELRTYTSTPGNLDKLHARFRDHTTRIFAKHGMKVVGYWTPTNEEKADDTLIYVLEHASREAADASWQAFIQDPEWLEVAAASNADGEILAAIEREYMMATDYSPLQ
ncbi:MAG: NIPSNAP family protein [Gammaproteobacteria bacterium]|nr:NIPSNAP family protein [Gammaproteobacteria bacterium]